MEQINIVNCKLKFSLNPEDKTASVIGLDTKDSEIIIPRLVKYDNDNYLVTSISDKAFKRSKIKSIKFEPDSKIQSIGHYAITYSLIQTISFPSNISEFKEGWCKDDHNFEEIKVIPNGEENIKLIENDKILVGKSDTKSDIFDMIIIAQRNIEEITIPPYIKTILPHAFEHCRKLKSVKISEDSQLQTIGDFAFYDTSIQEISIPSNILKIGKGWCCGTFNLTSIKILPQKEENIKLIQNNQILVGKSNSKSDIFDVLYFAYRNIEEVSIPPQIKIIAPYALDCCGAIRNLNFANNSQLETISVHSFASTSIEKIVIPNNVTKICEGAFCWCTNLTSVEFSENSKIETIEKYAFNGSELEFISIPSSVLKIDGFCSELYSLNKINVIQKDVINIKYIDNEILVGKSDVNKDDFDVVLFGNRNLKKIRIPSNIKRIAPYAFENCNQLSKIDVDNCNSQLQVIDENVFSGTCITSILIPSKVIKIKSNALSNCNRLKIIEVLNPDLLKIDKENDLYNFVENGINAIIMIASK